MIEICCLIYLHISDSVYTLKKVAQDGHWRGDGECLLPCPDYGMLCNLPTPTNKHDQNEQHQHANNATDYDSFFDVARVYRLIWYFFTRTLYNH